MLSFWLLLRQTLTEKEEKQKEDSAGLSDVHVEDQNKKGKLSFYCSRNTVGTIHLGNYHSLLAPPVTRKCISATSHNGRY